MNHPAIDLLDNWLADESGYDERAWPILRRALQRNRGQKAVCLECGPRIRAMLRCNPVRMFHREDGFTLIELLIVLAILGLIVGVVAMAGALPIGG